MSATQVRAHAKTVLVTDTRFMGPGVVALLHAIEATGSVKAACQRIDLSYSKGRRMLATLEKSLGPCVTRAPGGAGGGQAALTAECRTFLARFEAFSAEVDADVAARFDRQFPEFGSSDASR